MSEIKWWLRWKFEQVKHDMLNQVRSQRIYLTIFMGIIVYAIMSGDKTLVGLTLPVMVAWWIYIDYKRGVPQKWKRQVIVSDFKKKMEVKTNGNG